MRSVPAANRLIVALDFTDAAGAPRMARRLRGVARVVKVGSALFTACGPDIVRRLRRMGFGVMLDLKFFDIPSTVELSCRSAARLGVRLLTVHAAGGAEMLAAAAAGARRARRNAPQVLGVTVLTSVGGTPAVVRRRVVALARTVQRAGCGGVVASAREAAAIRARCGPRLMIVCPGIRAAAPSRRGTSSAARTVPPRSPASRDDQARVATPADALRQGADFLVVGRPITDAADPRAAARDVLKEMERAC